MTSKTSSVKSLVKFTLKKQTPQTLLITVFALIICPGMLIAAVNDAAEYRTDAYDMSNYFPQFSALIFVVAAASLVFLLISNFSFLFSKKAGDMYHSLPLTRNELLFSRTAASFIGAGFIMTLPYIALALSNSFFAEKISAETFLQTYLLMFVFLLTLTAFTLVFVVISGGIFDCLIALFSVNAGLPALGLVFVYFYDVNSYGIEATSDVTVYLSPFTFTVSRLATFADRRLFVDLPTGSTVLSWFGLIGYLLAVFIASSVICIKLFHIRKSETAGESYSFRFVPAVISTVISAAGGYLIGMITSSTYTFSELDFWIFFIIGALLCSVVFGVIANRGFKRLSRSFIRGGIAILLTVVTVIAVALVTKHDVEYVPRAEKVEKIVAVAGDCTFTEKEDINTFVGLHKKVVENYNDGVFVKYYETADVNHNMGGFGFEYSLLSGKKVERTYGNHAISAENCIPFVLDLMQSEAFYEQYTDCVTPEKSLILLSMQDRNETVPISSSVAKKIIASFKAEMQKADTDIFSEGCVWINIDGKSDKDIYIPKSFTETINLVTLLFPEPV